MASYVKFHSSGALSALCLLMIPVSAQADWNQNNDEANRQRAMSSMRATSAANDRQNADAQFQSGLRSSSSGSSGSSSSSGSSGGSGYSGPGYTPSSNQGPQSVVSTITIRETGAQMGARLTKDGQQGDVIAQYKLGVFYYAGVEGIPRDDVKARFWLKKAADQGNAISAGQYGYMLQKGIGGAVDPRAATPYFLSGAQKGDNYAKSWYALNVVLENDAANMAKATAYAVEAADSGELIAQILLGSIIYYEGAAQDSAKSFKYLTQAVAQNSAMGLRSLGKWYVYGGDGVTKDVAKGVSFLERSVALGDARAMVELSKFYAFGFNGIEKNQAKAVKLIQQAAAKNDAEAIGFLAQFNFGGTFGFAENKAEAVKLMRKAADLDDTISQGFYASVLYDGILVPKDVPSAVAYSRSHSSLRAKRGNPDYGAASGLPRRCAPRKDDSL